MEQVYTFWEGTMPDYIKLCMRTWKFNYVVLNYENLHEYTDWKVPDRLKQFPLPKIADVIRVHILRDNGGYWLDADTIMLGNELPKENILGYPNTRENTIGFLHTESHSDMFEEWAKYQDGVVANIDNLRDTWKIVGNEFTDPYILNHPEITIADVTDTWPETYMVNLNTTRRAKYLMFYFKRSYFLSDIHPTNMLLLHNSWTPDWYKVLDESKIMKQTCTLSNIFREVLNK